MKARPSIEALAALVTGRPSSLFAEDVAQQAAQIREALEGRRVLVLGGAGSIGSATVLELLPFRPASLCVIDPNENGLAELVRDIRSGSALRGTALEMLPLDLGSPLTKQFLEGAAPFDAVLNFAALKHVRSEKDRLSLLQMLDTNLLKALRFLEWLRETGFSGRYFCVSTDKAANPVNLMGASKRLMEVLAFAEGGPRVTSARFANVAFSEGSLLAGFLRRLEKGQPFSVPRETRRYFITPAESGQICLLAAFAAPAGHLLIPRMEAEKDLTLLEDVAVQVVRAFGFEPAFYDAEGAAKAAMASDLVQGRYPILLNPLDTSGEKEFEEFVAEGEAAVEVGLAQLRAIRPGAGDRAGLRAFLADLEAAIQGRPDLPKEGIIDRIQDLLPGFAHRETGRHLDQRM